MRDARYKFIACLFISILVHLGFQQTGSHQLEHGAEPAHFVIGPVCDRAIHVALHNLFSRERKLPERQ